MGPIYGRAHMGLLSESVVMTHLHMRVTLMMDVNT